MADRAALFDVLLDELAERVAAKLAARAPAPVAPPAPGPAPRPELLTVAEVAAELKVAEDTVREWIRAGALPASRPGGPKSRAWRVRRAELDAFAARRGGGDGPDPAAEAERILRGAKKGRR